MSLEQFDTCDQPITPINAIVRKMYIRMKPRSGYAQTGVAGFHIERLGTEYGPEEDILGGNARINGKGWLTIKIKG
jgi:hypothetical protein